MWLQICRSSLASTRVGYVGRVLALTRSNEQLDPIRTAWVHKKCSRVKGKLKEDPGYRCAKCVRGGCALGVAEEQEVVLEDSSSQECVNRFATWVTCSEQQGAVERRLGLESEGLGESSRSLQSC